MKLLAFFVCALASMGLFAQAEYKHQISFGSNYNVGWGGSATTADAGDLIDDYTITEGSLSFNYFHTLGPRFQLGVALSSQRDKSEIEFDLLPDIEIETKTSSFYVVGIYNFSKALRDAFYAGISLGKDYYEQDAPSGDTEYDLNGFTFFVGKRFALDAIGISNLTYSPMLTLKTAQVNGDLEDDGVDNLTTIRWDFLKLDLLF